jgi:transcriptional regulator GlxA family with amidase domain
MMLGMLAANHSQALVDAVADMLVCDRHRADSELQLVPMWSRKVQVQPKLNEVLEDRARRLLKQSSRSIVEITAMCGFVSTTHFSRCYRKYMGVSPRSDRASGSTEVYLSGESELIG